MHKFGTELNRAKTFPLSSELRTGSDKVIIAFGSCESDPWVCIEFVSTNLGVSAGV